MKLACLFRGHRIQETRSDYPDGTWVRQVCVRGWRGSAFRYTPGCGWSKTWFEAKSPPLHIQCRSVLLDTDGRKAKLMYRPTTGEMKAVHTHSRKGDYCPPRSTRTLIEEIRTYLNTCKGNNHGRLPSHKYCQLLARSFTELGGVKGENTYVEPEPTVPNLLSTEARALYLLRNERCLLDPSKPGDGKMIAMLQKKGCVDPWFDITELGEKALREFCKAAGRR